MPPTRKPSYPPQGWNQRTDERGNRYGKLTVLAHHSTEDLGSHREVNWIVECDCGEIEIVERRYLRQQKPKGGHRCSQCRSHGKGYSRSPVYPAWLKLRSDCDAQLAKFKFFRATFEHDFTMLKAELFGRSDLAIAWLRKDSSIPHSLTNTYLAVVANSLDLDPEKLKKMAAQGMSQRDIAQKLGVSQSSVSTYCKKFGIVPRGYEASARKSRKLTPEQKKLKQREYYQQNREKFAAQHRAKRLEAGLKVYEKRGRPRKAALASGWA